MTQAAAPPTNLDPPETSATPPGTPSEAFSFSDPLTPSARFRHSGWLPRRVATIRAFQQADLPAARLQRLAGCGSVAWVLRDPAHPDRIKLATNRCHDRHCEPCAADKRRVVARNLQRALTESFASRSPRSKVPLLRFITLTLKSVDVPLKDQIDRIYTSWRRLRNRRSIKPLITGGLAFLELTISPQTGLWHPHLHIIVQGAYLPKDLLRKEWHVITGDSYIVDVRAIRSPAEAASYVAKYAAKAIGRRVWSNPDAFLEAVAALVGRRTFNTFGTWTDLDLSKPPTDETDWEVLYPLDTLLSRVRERDPDALAIFRALERTVFNVAYDIDGERAPPTPVPDLPAQST